MNEDDSKLSSIIKDTIKAEKKTTRIAIAEIQQKIFNLEQKTEIFIGKAMEQFVNKFNEIDMKQNEFEFELQKEVNDTSLNHTAKTEELCGNKLTEFDQKLVDYEYNMKTDLNETCWNITANVIKRTEELLLNKLNEIDKRQHQNITMWNINNVSVDEVDEKKEIMKEKYKTTEDIERQFSTITDSTTKESASSKVDLVIILDASTSVTEHNFMKMLDFSKDLVDKVDIDSGSVRIGALIYSTEVEVQFKLNQYKTCADVKAAIDRIPYIYGSTNSADALKTMHEVLFTVSNGDRLDVDNVAFIVTDGISNINSRRTIPEAETAKQKGIKIYAIGIGLSDTYEIDDMASEPKVDHAFNLRSFDELNSLVDRIFGGKMVL